jgi:hypothetical protein
LSIAGGIVGRIRKIRLRLRGQRHYNGSDSGPAQLEGNTEINTTAASIRRQSRLDAGPAVRDFACMVALLRRQLAIGDPPFTDTDHLEAGNPRVSERVAHSHISEADENSLGHPFDPPLPF